VRAANGQILQLTVPPGSYPGGQMQVTLPTSTPRYGGGHGGTGAEERIRRASPAQPARAGAGADGGGGSSAARGSVWSKCCAIQ
jgi:hypothetical protein